MTRLESVAILASAGSGKTFALTSRFLALVLSGVAPERILAVTFTRAAASEILDRLLKRLCEASRGDREASKLEALLRANDSVPVPRLTAATCRDALRRLVGAIDRLGVGTIDSFFSRLAGAMSLDLDLPPGWTIADEEEDQRLRSLAVEEIVENLDHEETLRRVRLLHRGMYSARVFSAVLDSVSSSYVPFLDADARAWEEVAPLTEPLGPRAVRDAIDRLLRFPIPMNADGRTTSKPWTKARAGNAADADGGRWDAFIAKGLACAVAEGKASFSRQVITDEVREAYTPLIAHARATMVSRLRDQNLATRDTLAHFHGAYAGLRRRLGLCTFDDVPRALLAADAAGDLEHVYFSLDARIEHALIDEFQDTSLTQFRLLEPLLNEIVSDDSGGRSLLCVGDVKQSLYQWRQAEPELLASLSTRWSVIRERPLDVSRRSSPEIIETVNATFGALAGNPAMATPDGERAATDWGARFHAHATVVESPGFASLAVSPDPGDDDPGRVHTDYAAHHIAALTRAFPGDTVGVLLPTHKRIPRLLARLRAMEVDAVVESGAGVADSPAVAAVLSLLELADFPGNSAAAFHVATSPLGEVVGLRHPVAPRSADDTAAAVRRELLERGYAQTIGRWAGAIRGACDARDIERLSRLIELAERHDAAAGLRPSEFVAFASAARLAETTSAQVRLLTVHGSKGLQFARVVLPDLEDTLRPRQPPGVIVERRSALDPITAVSRYASEEVRAGHARLEEMHLRQFARLIGERLSVLYVAMTRAQQRLDMLLRPHTLKDAWPRTFAGLLHGSLAPGEARAPGAVLWSSGKDDLAAPKLPSTPPRARVPFAAPVVDRIAFAPGQGRPTRTPALSPSRAGAARPRTIAEALEPAAPPASRARGVLVHEWLEHIEWLDTPLTVEQLRDISQRAGIAWDERAAATAKELVASIRTTACSQLLSRGGAAARAPAGTELAVHLERSVAVRATLPADPHPRLIVGRLDRLVIGRSGGRPVYAEIVDYKTETGSGNDELVSRAYAPQLHAYRAGIASQYGIPPDDVRCCIALVLQGRAVWID